MPHCYRSDLRHVDAAGVVATVHAEGERRHDGLVNDVGRVELVDDDPFHRMAIGIGHDDLVRVHEALGRRTDEAYLLVHGHERRTVAFVSGCAHELHGVGRDCHQRCQYGLRPETVHLVQADIDRVRRRCGVGGAGHVVERQLAGDEPELGLNSRFEDLDHRRGVVDPEYLVHVTRGRGCGRGQEERADG